MQISETYDLRRLASDIYLSGVNLAERRDDWLKLMYSLAGGGEALLDSFLRLASQGSTYKERESRREFLKATRKTNDTNLAWFLKTAKELGYELNDYLSVQGQRDKELRTYRRNNADHTPFLPQIHPQMNSSLFPLHSSLSVIPHDYLQRCRSNASAFMQSLVSTGILTPEQAERAADLYHLGAMRDGSVIYWQIDEQGRLRDGKIMLYGPDCHRLKDHGAQWMGWLMRYKLRGADGKFLLPQEWEAVHCLFGQHLLSSSEEGREKSEELRGKSEELICVVEAEKTAVILSQLQPDKLWLAAGGESQLNVDKLAALKGHRVILYPDTDPDGKTYAAWLSIANEARRQLAINVSVSDLLETFASPDQKQRKIDLADFLIESREDQEVAPPATESPVEVPATHSDDPLIQELIDTFDLVEIK